MKTVSIALTLSLIIPIGSALFRVYSYKYLEVNMFSHPSNYIVWTMFSYILIDIFFILLAIYLNSKQKYYENSIMCGTLLASFILSLIINSANSFVYIWLK